MLFSLICINVCAQDIITTKQGEEIEAKVVKIGTTEIEYKKWSNVEGPSYTLLKNQVFMIKFQNGEKEVFEETARNVAVATETSVNRPYLNETMRDNYGSTSLYKFDDKQNLLDKAKRAKSAAKTFDWIAMPLGIIVGLGGMFAFDEPNMIWVGLGVEVGALIISSCLHSKASRLERKASLYYGWNEDFKIGNHNFQASSGILDNGNVGLVLNF